MILTFSTEINFKLFRTENNDLECFWYICSCRSRYVDDDGVLSNDSCHGYNVYYQQINLVAWGNSERYISTEMKMNYKSNQSVYKAPFMIKRRPPIPSERLNC